MKKTEKIIKTSFAGANTGKGFVSFYDTIFPEEELDGLYIIKGGSGTGKSTFMKKLGDVALKKGYTIEYYLCGSDAGSLDGIKIYGNSGKKVGVIDGTPPHPKEFRSPGAAGEILNFGEFWDSKGLREVRDEIDRITREKSVFYETAYRYLGATGKITSHIFDIAEDIYLREKGYAAAKRLTEQVGVRGECTYRQLTGYTMNGKVYLKPIGSVVKEYPISGNNEIASLFLSDVVKHIVSNSISAEISFSPSDMKHIDGIYFRETGVWLHVDRENTQNADKIINAKRFVNKSVESKYRQRIRFGRKCVESLEEGAVTALSGAKEKHFRLEEIYSSYMNFDALAEQSFLWYSEILSRLD